MDRLSNFRTEIMGGAILLVVFFHLTFRIYNNDLWYIPSTHGMIGVDVFFLLSGLGLSYSFTKNHSLLNYYYKRIARIFPFYGVVVFTNGVLLHGLSIQDFLLQWTTIGYWTTGSYYEWYVPNLILMYLVFPLWYYFVKHFFSISILFILLFSSYIMIQNSGLNFMAWARYPSFLIGVIIHQKLAYLQTRNIKLFAIILFVLCTINILWLHANYSNSELINNGWIFKPHILATPGFCLIISYIALIPIVSTILKWFGRMSFEVYLLSGIFVGYALDLAVDKGWSKPLTGVVFLFMSFVVAYFFQTVNNNIYLYFNNVIKWYYEDKK